MRQFRDLVIFTLFLLFSSGPGAAPLQLADGHPQSYTVQPGDTLWDIAGRFLDEPWRWAELWQVNPDIDNPNLIYPGDVVMLSYDVNGNPRLGIAKQPGKMREIKLSPRVRREALTSAVPAIPIDAIQQFLTRPRVVDKDELASSPKVSAFVGEHIVGGAGDTIYADSLEDPDVPTFDIVRLGKPYKDPDSGEQLGHEAVYVGDAEILRVGTPAKLLITASDTAVQLDDVLLPDPQDEILNNFMPRPAPELTEGRIIDVLNGVTQIGQFSLVVLNIGETDGLEAGHVMNILQRSRPPMSLTKRNAFSKQVELPLETVGTLMVFRSFDRVSYAMVMTARHAIIVKDVVRSPVFY